jgi:hypothetical protein
LIQKFETFEISQDFSRFLNFCQDFLKKIEYHAFFAHFEANFEAQNVNKKGWIFEKIHYFSIQIEKSLKNRKPGGLNSQD